MGFSILVWTDSIDDFSWCFICKWLNEDKWDIPNWRVIWFKHPTIILGIVIGFARGWDLLCDSPSSCPQRTWPFCKRIAGMSVWLFLLHQLTLSHWPPGNILNPDFHKFVVWFFVCFLILLCTIIKSYTQATWNCLFYDMIIFPLSFSSVVSGASTKWRCKCNRAFWTRCSDAAEEVLPSSHQVLDSSNR